MKMIKKILAVSAGIAMLGATMTGALATDLGDLPGPFVADGAYVNAAMVIGNDADALAQNEIKTYMDGLLTATSTDLSYADSYSKDFTLDDDINAFGDLDDSQFENLLIDEDITVNGDSISVHEEITIGAAEFTLSGESGDEDLSGDIYLAMGADQIVYKYIFDNVINLTDAEVDSDDPLEINFLGKTLKITEITADNKLALTPGETFLKKIGESVSFSGTTVIVSEIFSDDAIFTVNGVEYPLSDNDSDELEGEDLDIQVTSVLYDENDVSRSRVEFTLTETGTDTAAEDDQVFELYEDFEDDEEDTVWNWEISADDSDNTITHIGVTFNQAISSIDTSEESDEDLVMEPITLGGEYVLPNNFASVSFDSINLMDSPVELTIEALESYTINGSSLDELFKVTADDDVFSYSNYNFEKFYIDVNVTANSSDVWYKDSDNDWQEINVADVSIDYSDATADYAFAINATTDVLTLANVGTGGNLTWDYTNIVEDLSEEWEDTTLTYDTRTYESADYNVLTDYGVIIYDVENNLESDKIVIALIDGVPEATLSVNYIGSISEDTTSAALMTPEQVTDATAYNLILVGGPCVNSLTAQFEGVAAGSCDAASGYSANTGYVKLFDNGEKVALVVAGWEADDTKRAAKVVVNPASFALAGKSAVTVTGTGLEVSGITVA
ncbi:hypothetical protein HOD61_02950 [archaeon]|nr:hypothetical protein [archaeon]